MKKAEGFLQENNFLKLDINHLDYGNFSLGLHYHDTLPHNRLYIIHPDSRSRKSYIRQRGWNSERTILLPGSIYFIPANFDLEYHFNRTLRFAGLHFDLELFAGLDLFMGEKEIRSVRDTDGLSDMFWNLLEQSPSYSRSAGLRGITMSMAGLFSEKSAGELKLLKEKQDRFGPIFEWLRDNIRAGIQIQDLAELMGTSRSALSKSFSRHMGYSLKELISRELTREAVKRIVLSHMKFKEIARELQFNDEYYFSRFFTRQTGLSPREYRQRYSL